MTYDYSQDLPKVGDNILASITQMAREQKEAELAVAKAEEALETAKNSLKLIAEVKFPALMAQAEQTECTTRDGVKVKIKNTVRGSIPKNNPGPGLEWLEKHGHTNLIKRAFTILFGKDDEAWAKKFAADLAKRKKPLNCKVERNVHPSTLQAFVREQLEEGAIDQEGMAALGVFEQKVAVIDYPEEKSKF